MKKYPIHKDFKFVKLLTFPVIKQISPIADFVLSAFFYANHCDRETNVRRIEIPAQDGYKIKALLYEPSGMNENLPLLVYFHGGGFIYKAAPYHFRLAKQYSKGALCRVLLADYRTTPDFCFPTPINDCFCTLKWAIDNAELINIDKNKIAVGGDSAGGNLAAAAALMARDNGICLSAQMLIYPVTDRRMNTPSMNKFTNTPVWNSRLSQKMWKLYLPDFNCDNIGYASPLEATCFEGLPEAYIETAEFDCLHDEGVLYAQSLQKAGVKVTLNESRGTIHGYDMAGKSSITKNSTEKRISFLKHILS